MRVLASRQAPLLLAHIHRTRRDNGVIPPFKNEPRAIYSGAMYLCSCAGSARRPGSRCA